MASGDGRQTSRLGAWSLSPRTRVRPACKRTRQTLLIKRRSGAAHTLKRLFGTTNCAVSIALGTKRCAMTQYSEFLFEQATRCRRLAAEARDKAIAERLRELAAEYETRAVADDASISLLRSEPGPHHTKRCAVRYRVQ